MNSQRPASAIWRTFRRISIMLGPVASSSLKIAKAIKLITVFPFALGIISKMSTISPYMMPKAKKRVVQKLKPSMRSYALSRMEEYSLYYL